MTLSRGLSCQKLQSDLPSLSSFQKTAGETTAGDEEIWQIYNTAGPGDTAKALNGRFWLRRTRPVCRRLQRQSPIDRLKVS